MPASGRILAKPAAGNNGSALRRRFVEELRAYSGLEPPVVSYVMERPETKEFLVGYWLIDVDSAERAYAVAAEASMAPGPGGVPLHLPIEVRQVMSGPPTD